MATQIIYTCDKCKEIQTDQDQLWSLKLYLQERRDQSIRGYSASLHVELCRTCTENLGLLPSKEKDETVTASSPTLAEQLEEIIQEIAQNAVSNP